MGGLDEEEFGGKDEEDDFVLAGEGMRFEGEGMLCQNK